MMKYPVIINSNITAIRDILYFLIEKLIKSDLF